MGCPLGGGWLVQKPPQGPSAHPLPLYLPAELRVVSFNAARMCNHARLKAGRIRARGIPLA